VEVSLTIARGKQGDPGAHGSKSSAEQVTVDLDYLVFLHDFLRLNLAKSKELLGESPSSMIYDYSADSVLKALGQAGRAPTDIDSVVAMLHGWGFQPSMKEDATSVKIDWYCPIAAAVHPRLSPSEVGCPLGELVLGTIRQAHPTAQLESNQLTSSGAAIRIRKEPKSPEEVKSIG